MHHVYVLMMALAMGTGTGAHAPAKVQQQEFSSLEACENARHALLKSSGIADTGQLQTQCVEKQ